MKDIMIMTGICELIHQKLDSELKKEKINMKCSHMGLLNIVNDNDGRANIKDIVSQLDKKKSTVTEMINSLEKKGYLLKYQSKEDKRIYYVEMTEKAKNLTNSTYSIMNTVSAQMKISFSEEEQNQLSDFMERIHKNLSND